MSKLGAQLIKNVEINYLKADPKEPASPFGTLQWECQVVVDADRAAELADFGNVRPLKDDPTKVSVNLKRKALKRDGSPNEPVRVVDSSKQPIDNVKQVGNGSKGNVIVYRFEYNTAGRSGISTILTAIQITDLVKYTGGSVDFDMLDGDDNNGAAADNDMF